jgi:glycosyltransferase involved in cell wall biosynthesis
VDWLASDLRPDVVHFSLSLFLGFARRIKERLGVPVVCELQGEDIFFDDIGEPYRTRILETMRERAADVDVFVAPCEYYADLMSREHGFPAGKMEVVPLGIDTADFRERQDRGDGETVVGFFGRICPEKGFHQIVEAFRILAGEIGRDRLRLRAAGYLKDLDRPFFEKQLALLSEWGLADRFEHLGEVDRQGKVDFLASLDVYSLPAVYREPKGLPVLEAMASGVPAVLPAHGGFPELVAATGGGLLVEPGSPRALADGIRKLIEDPELRRSLGRRARSAVLERRNADVMAAAMAALYDRLVFPGSSGTPASEVLAENRAFAAS